jgi:hypothetical protein
MVSHSILDAFGITRLAQHCRKEVCEERTESRQRADSR